MQQPSLSALEHNLLSSLRGPVGVSEILEAGFAVGIEREGVVVGSSEPGVTNRVFLDVIAQPVVDHRIAHVAL